MKNNYLRVIGLTVFASSAFLFMSNRAEFSVVTYHIEKINSNGAPAAKTGAPGEASCTQCHTGAARDGNLINTLALTGGGIDYTPGAINSMILTLTDNSSKNGFQLVALDENDAMAGSFNITDATNTKLASSASNGRSYVTHTSPGNSQSIWSFDWNAPTNVADVTFYVATNKTDALGGTIGDVIYLSTHIFNNPNVSISSESINDLLEVGYSPEIHSLILDFPVITSNNVTVNVFDLSGKSVYFNNEGNFDKGEYIEKVRLPETMNNGIYVVTLFVGNQPYSKKFLVKR